MYTLQTFEEKANTITDDKIKVLNFDDVKKPVRFVCLKCGKEQQVAKGEVLLRKGKNYQCQFCHYTKEGETAKTKHKIENLCSKVQIKLVAFTKVGEVATFECQKCGHIFYRAPSDFLRSQKCPNCESANLSFEDFMANLKEVHGDEYAILNPEEYKSTRTPLKIKHSCGFIWDSTPHNLLHHSCPKCARKTSKGEKAIRNYFEINSIKYIWQWARKIDDKTLFFDFYVPDFNLAIEFQGEQHYKPVAYWGGEEGFKTRQINDNMKRDWCKKQGITLLEISFTQFDKINEILASSTTISKESTSK